MKVNISQIQCFFFFPFFWFACCFSYSIFLLSFSIVFSVILSSENIHFITRAEKILNMN